MIVKNATFGNIQNNCYLVVDEKKTAPRLLIARNAHKKCSILSAIPI